MRYGCHFTRSAHHECLGLSWCSSQHSLGRKTKYGPTPRRVLGPQATPVRLDNGAADSKPQPESVALGGNPRLEDPVQGMCWNAVSPVGDRAFYVLAIVSKPCRYDQPTLRGRSVRHSLTGIHNQIQEHLLQLDAVP